MAVQDGPTFKRYVANGVTTVFAIPFLLLDAGDLVVTLDDVPVTSGFILTGIGDPSSTATFNIAPIGDLLFRLVIPLQRLFDYQENGDFLAGTVNDDFDRLWLALKELRRLGNRSLKVSDLEPEGIPDLPSVSERVGKLLSFDSFGNPITVAGDSQSATELSLLLAASNGSSLVGHSASTVGQVLDQLGYVEFFGPVDTPENAFATWQTAINWCAANNVILRAMAAEYTIDFSMASLTIPDNFRCDLGNAWIKRVTGNTTPHDMWVNADIVNGNSGLDIRNVRFDGQRQADSLTNANAAHRFCGLRLVKCSGYLDNVRADNTVNGEIQVEGNRGAIMFDQSVDIKAFRLFSDGTMGSGVFPYQGKNYIAGVWTKNNTGSGFTSYGCDDNDFHHIYSDGSGFSGVSVNGERMRCSHLYGTGAALGFAGVNIGHNADGNRATLSQIDNVVAENNSGWGITVVGSPLVLGDNWRADGNAARNLFVQASIGLRVGKVLTRNAVTEDVRIEGGGDHWLSGDFRGAPFNGIGLVTSGATLHIGEDSIIAECGSAGGTTGALNASAGATIVCRGQVVGNLRYGAIANGAGAVVDFRGAKLDNNTMGDTLTVSGGVIRHELARLSNDPMSGTFTILSGTTSITVNNGNAVDPGRIGIMPTDSVSAAQLPRVSALTQGASFTVQVTSAPGANATYRYILI